jgi:hypothetical protein
MRSLGEHRLFYLSLGLIAIVAIATQATAYYYLQNSQNAEDSKSAPSCLATSVPCISVDTLINYGNTTIVWYNMSNVPANWNFYQLTSNIANVTAIPYGPPLNEHFVTGINGVPPPDAQSGSYSWVLWTFCRSKAAWVYATVGADSIHLADKSILAWAFESDSSQPPLGGQAKVDSC